MNESYPDNPTAQEPVSPAPGTEDRLKILTTLVNQAVTDCIAYINQCDREGIGMQTVTDGRKRMEKFLRRATEAGF